MVVGAGVAMAVVVDPNVTVGVVVGVDTAVATALHAAVRRATDCREDYATIWAGLRYWRQRQIYD